MQCTMEANAPRAPGSVKTRTGGDGPGSRRAGPKSATRPRPSAGGPGETPGPTVTVRMRGSARAVLARRVPRGADRRRARVAAPTAVRVLLASRCPHPGVRRRERRRRGWRAQPSWQRCAARSRCPPQWLGTTNPNPGVGAVVLDRDGERGRRGRDRAGGRPPRRGRRAARRRASARAAGRSSSRSSRARTPAAPARAPRPSSRPGSPSGLRRRRPAPGRRRGRRRAARRRRRGRGRVLAAEAARAVHRPWLHCGPRGGRPFVTWKYAATLDGRTAAADGTSRWITGDAARADVHRERRARRRGHRRHRHGARRRPAADRPRRPTTRQPLRVVLDSAARTPPSPGCSTTPRRLWLRRPTTPRARVAAAAGSGAEVVRLPRRDGRVDLRRVARRAVTTARSCIVLLEGGADAGRHRSSASRSRRPGRRLPRADAARCRAAGAR